MVTITKGGQHDRTGVDVFDRYQMGRVSPTDYIVAHVLGSSSRAWRRRMYFIMLKQGMWSQNDKLTEYARKKYQLFVLYQRETITESGEGLLEPGWTKEKALKERRLQYRLVKVYRAILGSKRMYREDIEATDHWNKCYMIALNEVRQSIISALTHMLTVYSKSGRWEYDLPVEEKLVGQVLDLLSEIYTENFNWKVFGIPPFAGGIRFTNVSNKAVLENLKSSANMMNLEQVVYFLKNHPHMPANMLQIFRIEYTRKGGSLDLQAPLPKD